MSVSILHMICFISLQMIILNVVKSEFPTAYNNATDHGSSWNSSRSKRSLYHKMPWILRIKVKYGTGETVTLKWIKCNPTLANENLPVITSMTGYNPTVMKDVGEFVMYHDIEECSAVVYFKKNHKLYGVIGSNHNVRGLPFDFDSQGNYKMGVAGEPFILTDTVSFGHIHPSNIPHTPVHSDTLRDFARSSASDLNNNDKRPIDSDAGPSTKHQRIPQNLKTENVEHVVKAENRITTMNRIEYEYPYQEYYIETLIFVTSDITQTFKDEVGEEQHFVYIIRYYLIYFNILDMIFKKSQTLLRPLHINIAKIVIENNLLPFNFLNNDKIELTDINIKLPEYLQSHQNQYAPDSFDYVFIQTRRPIWSGSIMTKGMTKRGANLYEARKNNQYYNIVPISVVKFEISNFHYDVAAHEIGSIFDLKIDLCQKAARPRRPCSGEMQKKGPQCIDCFKWNQENKIKLEIFFNTNRNRCFFLNYPRSLEPYVTTKPLRPNEQCECFGYNSYIKSPDGQVLGSIKNDECSKPLQCQNDNEQEVHIESTVVPFDGTPCAVNQICWDRQCIQV